MFEKAKNIGQYSIEHIVDQSNYAVVYKVRDNLNRCFILKLARKAEPDANELISREYHILTQIQHPNIVTVYDYGIYDGNAYFTLEYISGKLICEYFQEISGELYAAIAQILNALGMFHNRGFMHGDLKPENILYDPRTKRAVLIDFGLAGLPYQLEQRGGTIGYMAPEMMKGERGDQRSDLYSLGVMLYEILTTTKYSGNVVRDKTGKIPKNIITMLERLLSEEPSLRPTTAEVFRCLEPYIDATEEIPQFEVALPSLTYTEIPEIFTELMNTQGKMTILCGEVGLGKTRMLHELRTRYLDRGYSLVHYAPREHRGFHGLLRNFVGADIQDIEKEDKFQIFEETTEHLLQHAQHKKIVILVDDLNELTDSEFDLVRYIGHGLQNTNVSVIACAVEDERIKRLGFELTYLRTLTVDEIRSLLERTFYTIESVSGKAPSLFSDIAQWIYGQSGGNPLLIEYLLKALHEQNVLVYQNYSWQIDMSAMENITISAELKGLLKTQLTNLSAKERTALKVLSLVTHPLELVIINAVLETRCDVEIERLKGRGIIKEGMTDGKRIVFFTNRILQICVSEEMEESERNFFLKHLIDVIDKTAKDETYAAILAQLHTRMGDKEQAYPYLKACARDAEVHYNYDSALDYYHRLLEYEQDVDSANYPETLIKTARIEFLMGNHNTAIDLYDRALKARRRDLTPTISAELGKVYASVGNYTAAANCFKNAMLQPKSRDTQDYLKVSVYSLMYLKQHENIRTILDQPFLSSRHVSDAAELAEARYYQSIYEWLKGDIKKSIAKAQENLQFTEKHHLTRQSAYIENLLCFLFQEQGVLDKAHAVIQAAIDKFKAMKLRVALAQACYRQACLYLCEGSFFNAREIMNEVLIIAQQTDNRILHFNALVNLAYIAECLSEFPRAAQLCKKALQISPDAPDVSFSLAMILYKMNDIEQLRTLVHIAVEHQNKYSYFLITAMLNLIHDNVEYAITAIEKGLKAIDFESLPAIIRAVSSLRIMQLLIDAQRYEDALKYSLVVTESSHTLSREYKLACLLRKICSYAVGKSMVIDIEAETNTLREMGCIDDFIYSERVGIDVQMRSDSVKGQVSGIAGKLDKIHTMAKSINAFREIQHIEKIKAQLFPIVIEEYSRRSISPEYLVTFSRLAELINEHLGDEDFIHNVLDVVIEATQAERGALFMKTGTGSMEFVAGRNMDQTSIDDAQELSLTTIKDMKEGNVIFTDNALNDPDLSTRKSILINQIRSLLCISLSIGSNVIGAMYLDSRISDSPFRARDKDFLLVVSKILASVIDKSRIFHMLTEENVMLRSKMIEEIGAGYVLGRSPQMRSIYQLIDDVAPANLPVLIQGETGTGKGMLARLIHMKSSRKNGKFLTINCGAIPETLLESELFGYKRGAFTGAMQDKKGLLEEGTAGTVFLDEVANTSLAFQAKLLEAIEEKRIRRLGETNTRTIDVRFLVATNRDLDKEVKEGRFRKDLFYRINAFKIVLPPLRDRKKDIPELAQFFLNRFSQELNKPIKGFTPDATQCLCEQEWPGNVRELQNVIERAVVLTRREYLSATDLGSKTLGRQSPRGAVSIDEVKKNVIIEVLAKNHGNVKKTAEELGIGRVTLWRYMKKHHISAK